MVNTITMANTHYHDQYPIASEYTLPWQYPLLWPIHITTVNIHCHGQYTITMLDTHSPWSMPITGQ